MFSKIKKYIVAHKVVSVFILLIVLYAVYWSYGKLTDTSGETRYVLAEVQKATIIESVSGSGQVSALNQVDIKSKASGDIVYVNVINGQSVGMGGLIAQIDATDAQKAVRDAETALETARLELDRLMEPPDELSLLQTENSLIQAKESKHNADDALAKAYEDGFNTVSNAFLNLPAVMSGLHDVLYLNNINTNADNIDVYTDTASFYDEVALVYRDDTNDKFEAAKAAYDKNFSDYKNTSRFSDKEVIEAIIGQTYDTAKKMSEAVKSANNLIQFYQDKLTEQKLRPVTLSSTHLSSLSSYTGTTNSYLSSLLSSKTSIQNAKDSIVSTQRSIEERTISLKKLKDGPDDFDIRAKKITIQQREDALTDAKITLANCYVRAPFEGVIAKVNVKKADSVGSGTVVATLVTKQKIATVSLNEIDVARIKVGQKATLTFDAIEGLTISGEVAEVDTVGTVTQGVVTYSVKMYFDTQDDRVKSGMTISASIVTDVKTDVLAVPNGAIKAQGENYYVEMFDPPLKVTGGTSQAGALSEIAPSRKTVEIGLASDALTEIVSGLKEGDQIVARTATAAISATAASTSRAPSLFGGGTRIGR